MKLEVQWIGDGKIDWREYLPTRKTEGSSGWDIFAHTGVVRLKPGERTVIKTGWKVKIPKGYELQLRTRSGMAFKYGLTVLNSPGTIDQDYQGEIMVIVINQSQEIQIIRDKMAIAQAVLAPVVLCDCIAIADQPLFEVETNRGTGGLGSTGDYK
jgi:dUTP pyrophosphatase